MLNPMNEGKSLHELKCFIEEYDDLRYSFQGKDSYKTYLPTFRFGQTKLSKNVIQFYPKQLISLAGYYLSDSGQNREEAGKKLTEWLETFEENLARLCSKGAPINTYKEMLRESFDVPLYANTIPFKVILTEGEWADADTNDCEFPDPCGLPLVGGGVQKAVDRNHWGDYWKFQLAYLTFIFMEKSNIDTNALSERVWLLSVKKEVYTAFVLALWYAKRHNAVFSENLRCAENAGMDFVKNEDGSVYLPFEKNRLKRSFMVFSSEKNEIYKRFFKFFHKNIDMTKSNINDIPLMCFFYFPYGDTKEEKSKELKNIEEVKKFIDLPNISSLDSGYRIYDTAVTYYGLTLNSLGILLNRQGRESGIKIIPPVYDTEGNVPQTDTDDEIMQTAKKNRGDKELLYSMEFDPVHFDRRLAEEMKKYDNDKESKIKLLSDFLDDYFYGIIKDMENSGKDKSSKLLLAAGLKNYLSNLSSAATNNLSDKREEFIPQFGEILWRAKLMTLHLYEQTLVSEKKYYWWEPAKYLRDKRIDYTAYLKKLKAK